MASAGCLHMAQRRRSSPQFLICQQSARPLLTNIVLVLLCQHSPRSSSCVAWCRHLKSILLLTCVLCRHGANTGLSFLLSDNNIFTERCMSTGLSLTAKMLQGVCLDGDQCRLQQYLNGVVHCRISPQPLAMFPGTCKRRESNMRRGQRRWKY